MDARPWLFGILTREPANHRREERSRFRALARATHETVQDGPADLVAARVAESISGVEVVRDVTDAIGRPGVAVTRAAGGSRLEMVFGGRLRSRHIRLIGCRRRLRSRS